MRQNSLKAIGIFLTVVGVLTATINSWNAKYFGLQNATVAALTEHKTFALIDQVIPGFNLVEGTETFRFGKAVYPMKQPGGTIIGAMIYAPLYKANFTYLNHFDYVSHFITLGTSTLMMGIAAVVIYYLALHITKNEKIATITALIFPFATIIWPYAGVSHHDIYGAFWGLLAISSFYFAHVYDSRKYLFWAGIFSTLTLFFTMLPITLPLVLFGLIFFQKDIQKIGTLTLGMIIGVLPTSIFNGLVFGNPLLPPNLAGKVSDTVPLLNLPNLLSKLWFYLGAPTSSIFVFMPILLFGVLGIWSLRKRDAWLFRLLTLIPVVQLLHISSLETFGGYQYGPRYLLTVLACLVIGVGIWMKEKHSRNLNILFVVAVVYSIVVSLLGSIQTVMYPVPGPFAPTYFITQILKGEMPIFRLLPLGIVVALVGRYVLYRSSKNQK